MYYRPNPLATNERVRVHIMDTSSSQERIADAPTRSFVIRPVKADRDVDPEKSWYGEPNGIAQFVAHGDHPHLLGRDDDGTRVSSSGMMLRRV